MVGSDLNGKVAVDLAIHREETPCGTWCHEPFVP